MFLGSHTVVAMGRGSLMLSAIVVWISIALLVPLGLFAKKSTWRGDDLTDSKNGCFAEGLDR